ncbi:hypothetical protein H0485_14630, partial [Pseudogemmobacter sp. CC-YST710]|nr:hypothetical protein [Pseudogemmobacter faecipullorum]
MLIPMPRRLKWDGGEELPMPSVRHSILILPSPLMKISRSFLPGLFASLAGSPYRSLELIKDGVNFSGRASGTLSFSALSDSPSLKTGLLSSTITLPRDQDDPIILRGAPKAQAQAFQEAAETAWRAFNLAELEREQARVDALLARLAELNNPAAYPSACHLEPVSRESWELWNCLIRKLQPAAIGPEQVARLAPIEAFAEAPSKARNAAVDRFVEAELVLWNSRLLRQKGAVAQHRKLRGSGGGGVVRSLVFQDRGR